MNASTPSAATSVSGSSPLAPRISHEHAQTSAITRITRVRRRPLMRASTVNWSSTMTAVLTANDESDDVGRHLGHLAGVGREPGLHLAVADEHRDEGEQGQPQHGRLPEDLAVAAGRSGSSSSGLGLAADVPERPEQEGDRDEAARSASTRKIIVNVSGQSTST